MEILITIIDMIWLMLPAYLANPAAAISAVTGKPGRPIDFGRSYKGTRILGDGKTFKGFLTGIIFGIIIALIENLINKKFLNSSLPEFSYISMLTLPFGAMLGDLIASFFKRRLRMERGQAFPFVDQLDFVIGAWIITIIFAKDWFYQNFTIEIIIAAILLTPILHLLVNIIGYKIGVSREPW